MKRSFARRFEALERRRNAAVPMMSASEASGIKAALWRKLGVTPASRGHRFADLAQGS